MGRTVLGLFAIAMGSLCSPALGQDGPPVSVSPHQSPTVKGIDRGVAVIDAPFIGPADPRKEHRNEIVVTAPCSASAEQGLLSGSYIVNGERSDDYWEAIKSGVALRSLATRDLRRKLRKAAAPAYAIRILFAEGWFWIKNDAKRSIVVWTSGEPIEWKQEDGQVFDVSAQVNDEAVSLTFHAVDESERTTSYCSDGQQLVTETTIIGPLLSTPIRYRVVYNREADRAYESDFLVQAVERPSSQLRMPVQMISAGSALRQGRS